MSLLSIIIVLLVIGAILYLVNSVWPMPAWVRTTINVISAIFVLLWLAQSFGLIGHVVSLR